MLDIVSLRLRLAFLRFYGSSVGSLHHFTSTGPVTKPNKGKRKNRIWLAQIMIISAFTISTIRRAIYLWHQSRQSFCYNGEDLDQSRPVLEVLRPPIDP